MAKYDYMLQHARRNVWCNPKMDNQHVLAPTRVTSGFGALNNFHALGRFIPTPKEKVHTHVFQVGQITPAFFNLIERNPSWQVEKWFTFEEAVNQLGLYINIYNRDGVSISRSTSYFMMTREKCLMFAVERDARIQYNLNDDDIYFRFYTNAYFATGRGNKYQPKVEMKHYNITNMASILKAQAEYRASKLRTGHTEAYVNGYLVHDIGPGTVKTGDYVEWIYDASVKRIVDFRVGDLVGFNSTMDLKQKLLLHYQAADLTSIDYQDDIDVFMQLPENKSGKKGRYFPKHLKMSMRNLTHRDYSIVADFVNYISKNLIAATQAEVEYADVRLIMKIREGGYKRKLIKDNSRIFELYKLKDADVVRAMSGILSFPPVWHANNLEQAGYPEIMQSLYEEIGIDMVERGYGYNSISQILGDTPTKTRTMGTIQIADPPELLQRDATYYEYSASGKMLHWAYHDNDNDYEPAHPDCRLVEALVGRGSNRSPAVMGKTAFLTPVGEKRVYFRTEMPGEPVGAWQDITGSDRYRIDSAGYFLWLDPSVSNYKVLVRSAEGFLAYDAVVRSNRGMISFVITEDVFEDGLWKTQPMAVPAGQLQIWMNDNNLVRDIDYVVKGVSVYINNYAYLNQPVTTQTQRIHIRFAGFCNDKLEIEPYFDKGFVEHGAISNNGRYDIFDDKVQHISVGGGVMHKSDIKMWETLPGNDILNPMNGKPYQVEDILVPLKDYVKSSTSSLRTKSQAIDKMVSDYMSVYFGDKKQLWNSSAQSRWALVSPFFSHVIYLLKNSAFALPPNVMVEDTEVLKMCKAYESLFETDPLNEKYMLIPKFVLIRPHGLNQTIDLTRDQYRFLMSVVRLYGRDRVSINNFVTFTV